MNRMRALDVPFGRAWRAREIQRMASRSASLLLLGLVLEQATCQTLYHGWTSPVAGCSTTAGYSATEATADGGYFPYITGDSPACKAWKLAATICTTPPSDYSVGSNFFCANSGGFTDPVFGTFCAVSSQYVCTGCPEACNAQCRYAPMSLRNCAGQEANQPPPSPFQAVPPPPPYPPPAPCPQSLAIPGDASRSAAAVMFDVVGYSSDFTLDALYLKLSPPLASVSISIFKLPGACHMSKPPHQHAAPKVPTTQCHKRPAHLLRASVKLAAHTHSRYK